MGIEPNSNRTEHNQWRFGSVPPLYCSPGQSPWRNWGTGAYSNSSSNAKPTSDIQQSRVQLYRATLLLNFSSANSRHWTNMASSDTDVDIIINSALSIASTLYRSRQVNVRKRKRNSWARKQTTDQSQLGDRARNCERIEMVSMSQFSCSTYPVGQLATRC